MSVRVRDFGLIGFLTVATAAAGPVDEDVVRVARWLAGSFDNRAQAEADLAAGTAYKHEAAQMKIRPVQDPVVFGDALYLYVEDRLQADTRPYRQRIYRLKKSGSRVRLEVLKIDGQVLGLLALDPQMLSSLNPGDLIKKPGCDVLLEAKGGEFTGTTAPRSCKSNWQGSAYMTSTMRIAKDVIVTLDRGYDEHGIQTFGPTDGRGHEFRRSP